MQLTSLSLALTRAGFLTAAFSPSSLFANNEQGAWYDVNLTDGVLFQDSSGTTPVTAVEQPVGLMLDKSKGLVLGSELFSSFTSTGTWTVSGGTYSITSAAASTDLRVDFTGTAGKRYLVSFTASGVSGGVIFYPLNTSPPSVVNGTNTIRASSDVGFFIIRAPTGSSATISNISVRELPGNHAFQTTSASRPVLSARVNLLTKTEQFDDAVWNTAGNAITVSPNSTVAPDGTLTADTLTATATGHAAFQALSCAANTTYTFSFYAMRGTMGDAKYSVYDLTNATNIVAPTTYYSSINGSAFSRVTISFTTASNTANVRVYVLRDSGATGSIYIWGADLRVANDGVGLPSYQRVNTATDYDTTGFPLYLRCDGVDDGMVTNSIDFTATDKMTVWAGVRKLRDTSIGVPFELSANASTNNGAFVLYSSVSNGQNWGFGLRGTGWGYGLATAAAPITNVLTAAYDISAATQATETIGRVNGTAQTLSFAGDPAGTGNFGNHPLFLFRRNNTELPANLRFHCLILRGAASTTAQIEATEAYVNSKTKAY